MNDLENEKVEIYRISEFTFLDFVAASNGVKKKSIIRALVPFLLIIICGLILFGCWALIQQYYWSLYIIPFFLSIGLLVPFKEFFEIKNGEQDSISVAVNHKEDRVFCRFIDDRIDNSKKQGTVLIEVLTIAGIVTFFFMIFGLTYHFIDKLLESTVFYIWIIGSVVSLLYYSVIKLYQCYYVPIKLRKSKEVFIVNLIRLGIVPVNKRLTEFKISNGETIEGTLLFKLYFDPYPLNFLEITGAILSLIVFSAFFIPIHFFFFRASPRLNDQDINYIKALSDSTQIDIKELSTIFRQFLENLIPYKMQEESKEKLLHYLKLKS